MKEQDNNNFFIPQPTKQTCQVCGGEYTGSRTNLCENERCRKWYAWSKNADHWKYGPINTNPSGQIFYLDLMETLNSEKEDGYQ